MPSHDGAPVLLTAPSYLLGEIDEPIADLPELASRAAEFSMPVLPDLWGWGRYRRTERTLAEQAVLIGQSCIKLADVAPAAVDGLILCSTKFPGGAEVHGGFVQQIATGIGLLGATFHGLTLHRCANLLAAIELASVLVSAGVNRRILVITTDRVRAGMSRLEQHALFSDGGAGCLVTNKPTDGALFEILASASENTLDTMDSGGEISADLAGKVTERLLAAGQLEQSDLRALLHANLVKPVVAMKERQAGFTAAQLHLANITRYGHCFAADPLINLVDRAELGHYGVGDYLMLATSVPGERFSVLLRCTALSSTTPDAVGV